MPKVCRRAGFFHHCILCFKVEWICLPFSTLSSNILKYAVDLFFVSNVNFQGTLARCSINHIYQSLSSGWLCVMPPAPQFWPWSVTTMMLEIVFFRRHLSSETSPLWNFSAMKLLAYYNYLAWNLFLVKHIKYTFSFKIFDKWPNAYHIQFKMNF